MPIFEEEATGEGPVCSRCGRVCDLPELQECPICKHLFCGFCTYRIGARAYCSRACGDSFFFAGEVDEDESSEE